MRQTLINEKTIRHWACTEFLWTDSDDLITEDLDRSEGKPPGASEGEPPGVSEGEPPGV